MKKIRKPFAVVLSLAVLLSLFAFLTGCNKDGGSSSGSSSGEQGGDTQSEFVYVSEFMPINYQFDNCPERVTYYDGRFLATVYGKIADNTPEGVTPEYEGEYWEYGYSLFWIDTDGNVEKLENYTSLSVPEGMEGSSYTQNMLVAPDGSIITLDCMYTYYYDGPEGLTREDDEYWQYFVDDETYYIRTLAADGSEVNCFEMDATSDENSYFYPNGMELDDAGNIYVVGSYNLFAFDKEGNLLFKIDSEDYLESLIKFGDGRLGVMYYGENGEEIAYVDAESKGLTDAVSIDRSIYGIITGGSKYDFYYTNGSNFLGYDLESGTATKLFNWINCDINNYNVSNVIVLPDDRVVCMSYEWDKDYTKVETELVTIAEKPASSVPQKSVLTFATQYLDYSIRDKIIDFNRNNSEYRIEVKDYSEYNTDEDYTAGQTKLTTEILSGNVPDLIDCSSLPLERMVAKGMLEDLYPYIDSDAEISRDDFFPTALEALEVNGGLYSTSSSFSITTVIGASSVVGDEPGWTFEEFQSAYAKMPEGCTVFDEYMTRSDILYSTLAFEMDSLVDWTTGECSFDSPTFKNLLEFAASFPSEFDWENYDYGSDTTASRLQSGRQMLLQTSIFDFEYVKLYQAIFGTDVTYIGFPTENGTGNMFSFNGTEIAMSSKSENKDAAWQFIREFFTEDYQSMMWGFPININAFNEMLEDAMTPQYQTDENGNFVLDENGNKIEISQGSWSYDGVDVEMYALTQEQADIILDLIESTTRAVDYDSNEIIEMVTQEAEPFFAGQKSVDEVAKLVQSKINIFVNEQR